MQVGAEGTHMIWIGIAVCFSVVIIDRVYDGAIWIKLPLQSFFRVSAWLIFLFAIVFIGQVFMDRRSG